MAVDDAPVGMQSLDVTFSVGETIDAFEADELTIAGAATAPPTAASPAASTSPAVSTAASTSPAASLAASPSAGDAAFLHELLARVHANRRPSA